MTATVGVDVGGTFIKAVRRAGDGNIDRHLRRPTPRTAEGILDEVAETASTLGEGLAIGVGLAGLVDHDRGTLVWAPHLPGEGVEVAALSERLGAAVVVDNDANCAAVAEHRQGAARGADHVVMLTVGTGIGMGLVIDGHIHRGRAHAGEAGHMTVDPDGARCACGRRGCWETKVSGLRLDGTALELLGEGTSAADLIDAARAGHPPAKAAVEEAGSWLGVGIETLVLALDPDVVVVGGAAAQADLLLEPARRRLMRTEGAGHRAPPPVRAGILGPDAGAVGAAICASEETPA